MKKLANGYKILTDASLMDFGKGELIKRIRALEDMLQGSLADKLACQEQKKIAPKGYRNFFSGKVDLQKIIAYHERESQLGHIRENFEREEWHYKVMRLLEGLQK